MFRLTSCVGAFVVFVVGLSATTAQAVSPDATIRTVFISGDEAPGTDGARFRSGWMPVINSAGRVAFNASLIREGATPESSA